MGWASGVAPPFPYVKNVIFHFQNKRMLKKGCDFLEFQLFTYMLSHKIE